MERINFMPRSKKEVEHRRAVIWQWKQLGRWRPVDREVLKARFNIGQRQLEKDVKAMREQWEERNRLSDPEAIRTELIGELRRIQRLAHAHLNCRICDGLGVVEDLGECPACEGTGARLECSPQWAKVIQSGVEQIRKLAGIEAPPDVQINVAVAAASPVVLLQQVQQGIEAVKAAGLLTGPVED
jgi:hypothetical protein